MARLPDEQIERIKREVSLLRLVESQGYEVTKQGKDYVVHCPFHDDKTPSCVISAKSNLFHCFGCGAGGSVIDWVMKTQGVSFRFACEFLLKDIDTVSQSSKGVKRSRSHTLASSLAADLLTAESSEALDCVLAHYHQTLQDSKEALAYLEKRGLNDPRLVKTFKLGFANRTLAYHIPAKQREDGKRIRAALTEIGILRKSGHEHFNGAIVVPVFSNDGRAVELYGRRLSTDARTGTPKHLYLSGPHAGVWNSEGLKDQTEVILCESLIDAMTFWVHGFTHVTSSYGTQGFTDEHLALFKQLDIQRVLIAYDRDKGGDDASQSVAKTLQDNNMECFRILFPKGMDANQYAVEADNKTAARERLSEVIRKAQWLGTGKPPERQLPMIEDEDASSLAALLENDNDDQDEPSTLADQPIASADLLPKESPDLPPLPASPVPPLSIDDLRCEITNHDILLDTGSRVYRVRGFKADQAAGHLKLTLMVCNDNDFHTDTFDLYHAKQRQIFGNQAGIELGVKSEVIKKDLGKVLLKLEALQDEQREQNLLVSTEKILSNEEYEAALALLKDPHLLDRIVTDFTQLGLMGEDANKLVGYLACVSRKLDKPLGVVIQSSSAAGKSSLMDSILQLIPAEDRVQYSAMTGQSLFYMGETNLKHKTLAIAEEEGASNASYALKLLQSEGEVTIASTGKDDNTGDLVTKEYRVEGPTQLLMTTTAIDVDEELMNRCLILSVDESKQQTEVIHAQQRYGETLEGVFAKAIKNTLVEQHQNAQRLLKPYAIVNPYAEQLRFLSDKTRTRRDHVKYLTLIKTITLLHQHQRDVKTYTRDGESLTYLEVTLSDIEHANHLMHQVLGKSLDELPPQTRHLLEQIHQWVKDECKQQKMDQADLRFSRRQVRELCGWGETQTRLHLQRLADMEYLLVHRGGRGQSFSYELLYDGRGENESHLMGLLDTEQLKAFVPATTQTTSRGESVNLAGSSRPQRGEVAESAKTLEPLPSKAYSDSVRFNGLVAHQG